jgi:hypothetical protein
VNGYWSFEVWHMGVAKTVPHPHTCAQQPTGTMMRVVKYGQVLRTHGGVDSVSENKKSVFTTERNSVRLSKLCCERIGCKTTVTQHPRSFNDTARLAVVPYRQYQVPYNN